MMLDIVIFMTLGLLVISSLLAAASTINSFFVTMYDDYMVSIAWDRFKAAMRASDPLDMMDMQVMEDMRTINPKMMEMNVILGDLTIIFKDMTLRLILVSICSFRTPANLVYTMMTGRRFTWSSLVYIDIALLGYCTYFITVYN
jgi:hypothetical protein